MASTKVILVALLAIFCVLCISSLVKAQDCGDDSCGDTPDYNPTDPDDTPTDPEDTPTDPNDTPTDPDDTPTDPDDTPTDPDDTPTDPDDTPTDPPTDPDDTPTDPDDTPTDPDDTPTDPPTDPDDTPTDPDDTPTDPDDTPTDPDDTPTDPDDTPTDPDDTPTDPPTDPDDTPTTPANPVRTPTPTTPANPVRTPTPITPANPVRTPTTPTSASGVSISNVVTDDFFNGIISQASSSCAGKHFYSRSAFLDAVSNYPGFASGGSSADSLREIAAFFAQATHETQHFCFIEEIRKATYCNPSTTWPCNPNKKYYGRGPLQLTWNTNYGPAGQSIGFDGLNSPETVANNPRISFSASLWFWMKNVHSRMLSGQGFGSTIRAINGGECNGGKPAAVKARVGYYTQYCNQFGVDPGNNISC